MRALLPRLASPAGVLAVLLLLPAAQLIADRLLDGVVIDLTERRLFTLADASRRLAATLPEAVTLTLYESRGTTAALPRIADHARRLRTLLDAFAAAAKGRIEVRVVDPAPLSAEADAAREAGLQGVPLEVGGDDVFLGLVASTASGRSAVLPFARPERDALLEYEIARLLDAVARSDRPVLAIVSELPVDGGWSPAGARIPRWAFLDQLAGRFELRSPDLDAEDALDGVDVLLWIHPRRIGDAARARLRSWIRDGGPALVFVDPLPESDPSVRDAPFGGLGVAPPSDPGEALADWGLRWDPTQVVLDPARALTVSTPGAGAPRRHPAMPAYGPGEFSAEDPLMEALQRVNFASAGALEIRADAASTVTPLIRTTDGARLVDAEALAAPDGIVDAERWLAAASTPPASRVVAARVHRPADADAPPMDLIVIADTDLLADGLWVTVEEFFGRAYATPWANNGDLVLGAADQLAGSSDLVALRARAGFARPFDRVEDLRRDAETSAAPRVRRLEDALAQLALRAERGDEAAGADALIAERARLRTELREARRALRAPVDALGRTLLLVNALAGPALVLVAGLGVALLRRRRARTPAMTAP